MSPSSTFNDLEQKSALNGSCDICRSADCLIHNNFEALLNSKLQQSNIVIKCKKGQQFIIEGAPVNGLFFIKNGTVKVFRTGIMGGSKL